jgi:predicted ATPase
LLRSRSQQYHHHIAEVLVEQFPSIIENQPELPAHHYTEAFEPALAVPFWKLAGQRALERFANQEAIGHLTRGLEILQSLPATPERDKEELEMQISLAPALMVMRGWASAEVEQASRRARDLSNQLGDERRLYSALWGLWSCYHLRGQLEEALEIAGQVLAMAKNTDNRVWNVAAQYAAGYTNYYRGDFVQSRKYAEQGIKLSDPETDRAIVLMFQFSTTVAMRMYLAGSLWMLGYADQAQKQIVESLDLAKELDHTPSIAYALAASCYFYQSVGDFRWVQQKTEELIRISRDEGFLLWVPVAMIFHGWALALQGRAEEGAAEANEGLALFRATGSSIILPHVLGMLGQVLWKSGRSEDALSVLNEGMHEAASRNEHHMEPELYRIKAEILRHQAGAGPENADTQTLLEPSWCGEAEACFLQAMELSRVQGALMLELRSAVGLSRLWEWQGKQAERRQLISGIYDRFTEGFDSVDLQEARAILEGL